MSLDGPYATARPIPLVAEEGRETIAGDLSVYGFLQPPLPSVTLDMPVGEVRRQMQAAALDALPVIEDGHLVGVVSRAELEAMAPEADERQPLVACIRPRVVYCFADTRLEEAAATLKAAGVGHLAVLGDDLNLLGLLARSALPAGLLPVTPRPRDWAEGTAPGLDR